MLVSSCSVSVVLVLSVFLFELNRIRLVMIMVNCLRTIAIRSFLDLTSPSRVLRSLSNTVFCRVEIARS